MTNMFLGSFCADDTSLIPTCTSVETITTIEITNGVYDELYGSTNVNLNREKELEWDFDTQFYAKFQNNLAAGNVDYTSANVSSIRIKRRMFGEHKWLVLKDIPINTNEDFSFEYIDRYAKGNTQYDYSLVPVMGGIDGNINKNTILSDFDGYFIMENDISYPIVFNTNLSTQLNKNVGVITTLGRKYPFAISNGLSQYVTGSLKFALLPPNCDTLMNISNKGYYSYTKQFDDWILNGKPKIIKDWTGQIYMVNITNSIPIDYSIHQLPSYDVQFVEIGNAEDQNDLYYNGFTDVNFSLSSAYQ